MLQYDRIDISEGIDINKTSVSKKCDICHHCKYRNLFAEEKNKKREYGKNRYHSMS